MTMRHEPGATAVHPPHGTTVNGARQSGAARTPESPMEAGERVDAPDELRALLCTYHEVLVRSRRLPAVVWMSTRARGSAPTGGWLRLPPLPWGTHHFVLFHVERSVRSLARLYAARAALGVLDEQGRDDRQAV